jgi:prolipoprotein diacylglyceryltransferase
MVWMPEQVWLKVGVFEVEYVALYAVLSFWIATLLLCKQALEAGSTSDDCFDWLPYGLVGAVVGARVGYFVFEIPAEFLAEPSGLLWQPGYSLHGTVFGLLVATAIYARSRRMLAWTMWDNLAMAGASAFLLMSLGLLFDSHLAGAPASGPLSLTYPLYDEGVAVPPRRLAAQHMQVVLAGCIAGATAALQRRRSFAVPGMLACTVLTLLFLVLLVLEPWKEEAQHVARAAYRGRAITWDAVGFVVALGCLVMKKRQAREGHPPVQAG